MPAQNIPLFVYQQLDVPPIPYVTQKKNLSSEPASNWSPVEYFMPSVAHGRRASLGDSISNNSNEGAEVSANRRTSFLASSIRNSIQHIGNEALFSLMRHSERPSELHSVHDLEINEVGSGNLDVHASAQYYLIARFT
jgi:hypothetical protein